MPRGRATADAAGLAARPRVGRPARVDRAMIARAAFEVGLDRITMKAVADRLGVSVPGLYHHVRGRDDLMRLAAEFSAAQLEIPVDRGQSWPGWLLEWARYSYDAFVSQPALLGQFVKGALGVERMMTHVDRAVGVLTRHGFTADEALDAYALVSDTALGAAVAEIRAREAAHAGNPLAAEYRRVLAAQPHDALVHLREATADRDPAPPFAVRIATVLVGIAVQRGEPWEPIVELARAPDVPVPTLEFLHP